MNHLHRNLTITACCVLSAVLGTIHAFSVFIPQWEGLPGADRASVSLIYSAALVCLTIAVLFGYRLYQRFSPFFIVLIAGAVAAIGLLLSAYAASLISLYITYGLIFGGANGVGYGYALQLSGQAAPNHRGLAMGLVTAFYAVGATVAPLLFTFLIERGGNALALQVMSAIVLLISLLAAGLIYWAKASYQSEPVMANRTLSSSLRRSRFLMWLGYGGAVAAGLMVIGHAYGIATWMSLDTTAAAWATTLVVFGNMLGGFSAGYFADRISSRSLLCWLPLFTAVGLVLLLLPIENQYLLVYIGLGLVGYCYGALIAVYPVAVADVFGAIAAPRIYGQIFTAWGLAGLLGPWLSGWLFDQSRSYTVALVVAMLLSFVSIVAIRLCFPKSDDLT